MPCVHARRHHSEQVRPALARVEIARGAFDAGVKTAPKPRPTGPKTLTIPAEMKKALAKSAKAASQFSTFSYSKKKEYVEWLTEAKTEATRLRRLETAIEWIAEGKGRNWKYEKC